MAQTQERGLALTVRRTFAADRARVFRAWTEPTEMTQWLSPEGMQTPKAQVDLSVGGAFRIEMEAPDGSRHVAVGTYREINAPERLVFTWAWEGGMEGMGGETLVTIELHEKDGGTEVILTHEGLPAEEARKNHEEGWVGTLVSLESYL